MSLSGITKGHLKEVNRLLTHYLHYVEYKLDKAKSIEYFKKLQSNFSISYYKKQMYQIMKLLSHFNVEWAKDIKLPSDPYYTPKFVKYLYNWFYIPVSIFFL